MCSAGPYIERRERRERRERGEKERERERDDSSRSVLEQCGGRGNLGRALWAGP
jgi:hypothetical protein